MPFLTELTVAAVGGAGRVSGRRRGFLGVSGLRVGKSQPGRWSIRGVERGGRSRISIRGRSSTRSRKALARSQAARTVATEARTASNSAGNLTRRSSINAREPSARGGYALGACEMRTMVPEGSRNAQSRGPQGWSMGSCSTSAPKARTLSKAASRRSEEHTSELQSRSDLVCRLLLEKKKKNSYYPVLLRKKKKTRQQ